MSHVTQGLLGIVTCPMFVSHISMSHVTQGLLVITPEPCLCNTYQSVVSHRVYM